MFPVDRRADLGLEKIVIWILALALLVFVLFFYFGLDKVIKNGIEAFFSWFP